MNEQQLTYEQALSKLKNIVEQIEHGNISVDQLAQNIKEAKKLLEFCINTLVNIEKDVTESLNKFSQILEKSSDNH